MRLISDKLLKQSYGHVQFRPMFLPVEWRLNLKLEGDLIEAITPNSLISVRYFLNNTAMDIMYYSSPTYQAEVPYD
uniref:Uncharacterized protein n=1 Tax=Romanomermis culicivorax TaxID=13658 RepID=A0A915KW29_ROMCU